MSQTIFLGDLSEIKDWIFKQKCSPGSKPFCHRSFLQASIKRRSGSL